MTLKFSRRLVAEKLVDMLESGRKISDVAKILAAYLINNHETRQMELYLRDIRNVLEKRKSYLVVDVSSANKLSENLNQQISEYMKNQTGAKSIEIINTIKSDLISGVILSTTDSVYDDSLKNKIKKLRMI